MVGHGGSSASSYLADPTSPIPSHCASIIATGTLIANMYSRSFQNVFLIDIHWISHYPRKHLIFSTDRYIISRMSRTRPVLLPSGDNRTITGTHTDLQWRTWTDGIMWCTVDAYVSGGILRYCARCSSTTWNSIIERKINWALWPGCCILLKFQGSAWPSRLGIGLKIRRSGVRFPVLTMLRCVG